MKLNLSDKLNYSVKTKDGKEGHVVDFLFDEEKWKIRYLEVDMGGLFTNQRVLVPIELVSAGNWIDEVFKLSVTSKKLKKMPSIQSQQTVSRAMEAELAKHFKTEEYWGRRFIPSMAPPSMGVPKMVFEPLQSGRVPDKTVKEDDIQTNLRSFKEIQGYDVFTTSGKVGKVEDILIESKNMEIISIIIRAKYGLDYSKSVIIATNWLKEISYVEQRIRISLHTDEVLSSPKFEESAPVNEKEVVKKFDYTGKPIQN
ncbi:MAG: PRC-barrel domain-containing protein [Crocinitomicaceae bacterium]|nr:PRC-barrel domain-containing protein [Crocinitomicaceae bacterium]